MKTVTEYIAENIPSIRYLREHYMKMDVYIDTRSEDMLFNLKKAHELRDKSKTETIKAMRQPVLSIGSYIHCKDEDYDLGRVTQFFHDDDGLMLVHFKERKLPTMCSRTLLTTVHDDTARKLKVIY